MFKVLNQTNELASFFSINYTDPYFIDFSGVEDQKYVVDMNTSINTDIAELNTTKGSYLELIQEYTFDDIVSFKDTFLEEDDDKYSILISDFTNNYEAYSYIKLNRLMTNSFTFDYFKENGKLEDDSLNKKITVATNIAHGIYDDKKSATEDIDNNFDTNEKKFKVYKISKIKDMYSKYVDNLSTSVKPYIIKPIKKKVFKTDPKFKKAFLEANKDYFTINIVSLSNMQKAEELLLSNNIINDSFVFRYGRNGKWIKVVYGIFETYSQALEALNQKENLITKYHPVIEKISHKQDLYYKYEKYNIPKVIKTKAVPANKEEIRIEKEVNKDINKTIIPTKLPVLEKEVKKDINKTIIPTKLPVLEKEVKKDINKTIMPTKLPVLEKEVNKDIKEDKISFKTRFLNADPKIFYTMNMALFTSNDAALKFVEKNNIKENSIIIPFKKNSKEYYKIMYGLYKSKNEAQESIRKLPKNLSKNKPTIEGVKRKQILFRTGDVELSKKAYVKYKEKELLHKKKTPKAENTKVNNKITKRPSIKTKKDNSNFVKTFNNASDNDYTIRIAYVTPKRLDIFLDTFVLDNNFIVHKVGENYRILYGVYKNKNDALSAIGNLHPKRISKAKIFKIKSLR
jgi:septal ring-binding cell division protein DamX